MKHTLWALIVDTIRGDPLQKQYERVEEAMRSKAQRVSDAEFNRTMANFYTERVMEIDPWKDHIGFSNARSKQLEYQNLHSNSDARVEEASAQVDAQIDRYVQLQHGLAKASEGHTP